MALKARRVVEVPMVIPVPWGPLGRRESSESPDCQGTQEGRGQRVLLDSLDSLVPMERRVAGGHLESLDPGDNEAQRVRGVKEALGASRASLAPRATLEVMVRLALLVSGDPTDLKDPRDSLDQRALQALQARTGSLDTLDREARRVSKARLALQAHPVWLALRVPREKRVQWESVAILGPLVLLVNRGSQALLEKKGQRVTQALLVSPGKMALQDCVASLGTEGSLVRWELLD